MKRLARQVEIKGILYKVVQVAPNDHRLLGDDFDRWAGTVDYKNCEILVDRTQSLQHKWQIFWHEVVHIIVAGCNDMHAEEEALVDIIGVEVFSICRQLKMLGNGGE